MARSLLSDTTDTARITVSLLVVVATVHVALAVRDLTPQLAYLNGLVDISAYLITVEEERRIDVVCHDHRPAPPHR